MWRAGLQHIEAGQCFVCVHVRHACRAWPWLTIVAHALGSMLLKCLDFKILVNKCRRGWILVPLYCTPKDLKLSVCCIWISSWHRTLHGGAFGDVWTLNKWFGKFVSLLKAHNSSSLIPWSSEWTRMPCAWSHKPVLHLQVRSQHDDREVFVCQIISHPSHEWSSTPVFLVSAFCLRESIHINSHQWKKKGELGL